MGKREPETMVVAVYIKEPDPIKREAGGYVQGGYVVVMPELDLEKYGSLAQQMMIQRKTRVLCKLDIVMGMGEFRDQAGIFEHLEKLYKRGVKLNINP